MNARKAVELRDRPPRDARRRSACSPARVTTSSWRPRFRGYKNGERSTRRRRRTSPRRSRSTPRAAARPSTSATRAYQRRAGADLPVQPEADRDRRRRPAVHGRRLLRRRPGRRARRSMPRSAAGAGTIPDPYDFLNVFFDGNNIHDANNNNLSYFNVPAINKQLEQAASLTGDARYERVRQPRHRDRAGLRASRESLPPVPAVVLLGPDGSRVLRLPADLRAAGPRGGVLQVGPRR